MRKCLISVLAVSMAAFFVSPVLADHDEDEVKLVRKSTTGVWPEVGNTKTKAELEADDGDGTVKLKAKTLYGNTWYLLTLQGASSFGGTSNCLFGAKVSGSFHWCDVALVRTDKKGKIKAEIPTSSGLSSADLNTPTVYNPDEGPASGSYTGVGAVLKEVGCGDADCSVPNLTGLAGRPGLLAPGEVLFEQAAFDLDIP